MKRVILLFVAVFFLAGCASMSFNWKDTAYEEGWIPPEEIPEPEKLEKGPPLPKPTIPILKVRDEEGNPIEFTKAELMQLTIKYGGTVDKFKFLVEIYERQYTSRKKEQAYYPDMSLEELKLKYFELLGIKPSEAKEELENEKK